MSWLPIGLQGAQNDIILNKKKFEQNGIILTLYNSTGSRLTAGPLILKKIDRREAWSISFPNWRTQTAKVDYLTSRLLTKDFRSVRKNTRSRPDALRSFPLLFHRVTFIAHLFSLSLELNQFILSPHYPHLLPFFLLSPQTLYMIGLVISFLNLESIFITPCL